MLSPPYVIRNAAHAYLAAERQELEKLSSESYRWDKDMVCPKPEPDDSSVEIGGEKRETT